MAGLAAVNPIVTLVTSLPRLRRIRVRISVATLTTIIIGVGILLRLVTWRFNHSLWLDEIYLALNIEGRSFAELWQPLNHDQGAPIGFLMSVKLATTIFGTSEMVLRLVPLLAGIGSMILFAKVSRQLLAGPALVFATVLFALSPKLVDYSCEVKQYSSDVFVTLILLSLAFRQAGSVGDRSSGYYSHLVIAGAVAIWFSHPSVFVMAGLGIVLFGVAFWRSDENAIRGLIGVGIAWLGSFAICYFVCLRDLSKNQYLMNYWSEFFAPALPHKVEHAAWYLRAVTGLFEGPGGMMVADVSVAVPALLLFGFGWLGLWRRKPVAASCLIAPLVVTMVVSMCQRYPFGGRLLLFAVPLLHLGLGSAFAMIYHSARSTGRSLLLLTCGVVALAPAATALQQLFMHKPHEDHRAAVSFIANHIQPGDGILLSGMAREPWDYYADKCGVNACVVGQVRRDDWNNVQDVVKNIEGHHRVWVFVAHEREDNRKMLLWQLDQVAVNRAKFVATGNATYLYEGFPVNSTATNP